MTETPPLLTVTLRYAHDHRSELDRHEKAGGVIRIFNAKTRELVEYRYQGYRGPERPSCLDLMPDDLDALRAIQRERYSRAARSRPWAANFCKKTARPAGAT